MKDEHETVVVDFKFGKPKPEYHDQIKGYMKLLESMGHAHVKGYLWYVYPNKIEEVL
jgi:CRISPR/Cas system-associated exonuclease Cas4 (RecB family)